MRVRIKNNRLALEGHVENLSEISEEKLREIAARYQIGWQKFTSREVEVISRGRSIMKTQEVIEPKSRKQIEDEIRSQLTIKFFIPKEYWTKEQEEAFNTNDLLNEKDISREQEVKKASGIMHILPPFEVVKDKIKTLQFLTEVTENQWEYLKQTFNKKFARIKNEEGQTIGKKESYVHRLVVDEYVPENEEDEARLKEEAAKKAEKKGKKDEEA